MFATGSLARRIERAEATLIADCASAAARRDREPQVFVMPIRGVAAFVEPGSPVNKVAGLGFDGVPNEEEIAAVEAAYATRRCPVVVELSSFADPLVGRLLTQRGYELIGYENRQGCATDSSRRRKLCCGNPRVRARSSKMSLHSIAEHSFSEIEANLSYRAGPSIQRDERTSS